MERHNICNEPEPEAWDVFRIMSRGLALLSVCCGQGTEEKEYLVDQVTYVRVENTVNLYAQGLSESQSRGGNGWQEPTVRAIKETSTA